MVDNYSVFWFFDFSVLRSYIFGPPVLIHTVVRFRSSDPVSAQEQNFEIKNVMLRRALKKWSNKLLFISIFSRYSGDLKFDHLISGNIWNSDSKKFKFQMVRFSNGGALVMALALVLIILKTQPFKIQMFCPDFNYMTFLALHCVAKVCSSQNRLII